MLKLLLIPALITMAALITLITARDIILAEKAGSRPREVFQRKKNGKKITKSGYVLIVCVLATIILSYWQHIENQKEIERTNLRAQMDLDKRDSVNANRIEKNKNETIEALAAYSLGYDSVNKKIFSFLKDSSLRNKASVGVCLDGTGFDYVSNTDNALEMKLRVCNYGQEHAYNFRMGIGAVIKKPGKTEVRKVFKIPIGVRISSTKSYEATIKITDCNTAADTIFIFLKGSYLSANTNKSETTTEFFICNLDENKLDMIEDKKLTGLIRNISFNK